MSILKNIVERVFPPPNPKNVVLTTNQFNKISERVKASTGFSVACRDARFVNGRQWLGLVMAPGTEECIQQEAELHFIDAVRDVVGKEVLASDIVHYYPETAPIASRHVSAQSPIW